MTSSGRPERSSPGASRRSSSPRTNRQPHKGSPAGRPQPTPPRGPGTLPLLLGMLVLAAVVAVLARSGRFSSGGLRLAVDDTPACPAPVNRWADQRIALLRTQLQKEHNLYRNEVQAANGIGAMMTWVDDRIIDQHLAEERQRIRSSVLQSSRCLVEFQP